MEKEGERHGLGKRERLQKGWRAGAERSTRRVNSEEEKDREKKSLHRVEKGTSCPFPSSLSFLISLKERRSIECKCTVILTLAKVSRDVSTCAPFPAGHFGTGRGPEKHS